MVGLACSVWSCILVLSVMVISLKANSHRRTRLLREKWLWIMKHGLLCRKLDFPMMEAKCAHLYLYLHSLLGGNIIVMFGNKTYLYTRQNVLSNVYVVVFGNIIVMFENKIYLYTRQNVTLWWCIFLFCASILFLLRSKCSLKSEYYFWYTK